MKYLTYIITFPKNKFLKNFWHHCSISNQYGYWFSKKYININIKKNEILKASSHPHTHKIYMQVMQLKLDVMDYNRKVYVCRNEREREGKSLYFWKYINCNLFIYFIYKIEFLP